MNERKPYEPYFLRLNKGPFDVHCIDDRGYRNARPNVKTAAGPAGLAVDTMAARFFSTGQLERRSVGSAAEIIAKLLGGRLHEMCAGEDGLLSIARFVVDNPQQTLKSANVLAAGDISGRDFEKIHRFYKQFVSDAEVYGGPAAEAKIMQDAGVPRSALAHASHKGGVLIANHVGNTRFDAGAAYKNGSPYYVTDVWAQPALADRINTVLPHDNTGAVVVASLVRHAAISHLLPAGNGNGTGVTPLSRVSA